MSRLGIPTGRSRCHRKTSLPAAAAAVALLLAACATASDGAEFELVAVDLPGGQSTAGGFVFPGEDPATGGPTLRVVEGQQVTITLISPPDGRVSHDLAIVEDKDAFWDEFEPLWGAATDRVIDGQQDTITFTAGPPGTYGYVCTIPEHARRGMKGDFVVEGAA